MRNLMHGSPDAVTIAVVVDEMNHLRTEIEARFEVRDGHLAGVPSKTLFRYSDGP